MRKFGEPIKQYLIEEDTLLMLLVESHMYHCGKRNRFEYFWDRMVESGYDQNMSHDEFVEAVNNMTFMKLAETDLVLYKEYKDKNDCKEIK